MDELDLTLLRQCAELGHAATPVDTAFSVGAILADADRRIITTAYSRELGPTWHAEAVAVEKARQAGSLDQAHTLYCSLEPCSRRKSGRRPCCDVILQSPIERVVFIAYEPAIFVTASGAKTLVEAGLRIDTYPDLTGLVQAANAHVWPADYVEPG
ncbi:MAG: deaminase [Pseudomonadota bacterium]